MITKSLSVSMDRVTAYHVNQLVSVAAGFESTVCYEVDGKQANGKSIIGMISLQLKSGQPFTLTVSGVDEVQAAEALEDAIAKLK